MGRDSRESDKRTKRSPPATEVSDRGEEIGKGKLEYGPPFLYTCGA